MKKMDSDTTTTLRRSMIAGAKGLVAATASIFAINAHACILAPGTSCPLTGTTVAAESYLGGTVIHDDLVPFSISLSDGNTVTGTVQDRVVQETSGSTLDFSYRISNNDSSTGSIDVVVRHNFEIPCCSHNLEVNYRNDGSGDIGPGAASRTSSGSLVAFGFGSDPIGPDMSSKFFFVKTPQTNYDHNGTATLIGSDSTGGFGIASFATYEPLGSPVPLPPAAWLFGSGMLGLAAVTRRKKASVA